MDTNTPAPAQELSQPTVSVQPTTPPVDFRFEGLDGTAVSTASVSGRITVIGMIATYDVASSAQARFLTGLSKNHVPRVNAVLLVLEPKENRPMIEGFVSALSIDYPVAFAGPSTIAGEGPFDGLHHIPSIVILDPAGREVFRHIGLIEGEALEEAVSEVERALSGAQRPAGG